MHTLRASAFIAGTFSLALAALTSPIAADTSYWSSGKAAVGVQQVMAASHGRIAYLADYDEHGNTPLQVMDANGRHVRRLSEGGIVAPEPQWSPDGQRIVFTQESTDVGGGLAVWVVSVDSASATTASTDFRRGPRMGDGSRTWAGRCSSWMQMAPTCISSRTAQAGFSDLRGPRTGGGSRTQRTAKTGM